MYWYSISYHGLTSTYTFLRRLNELFIVPVRNGTPQLHLTGARTRHGGRQNGGEIPDGAPGRAGEVPVGIRTGEYSTCRSIPFCEVIPSNHVMERVCARLEIHRCNVL